MATYEEYMDAARKADAAGAEDDARRLVEMAKKSKAKPAGGTGNWLADKLFNFLGENEGQRIVDVGRAAAQGASFGLSDEAEAGIRALRGEDYGGALKDVREKQKAFQKSSPIASTASEIVGGASLGMGLAKGASAVAPQFMKNLPTWAKVVGSGAGYGAGYGAGSGEGAEDRLGRAIGGAGSGALGAGLMYGAGRGLAAAGRTIGRALSGPTMPQGAAKDLLAGDFVSDKITPNQIKSRLKFLGPRATIADVGGEEVRKTVRNVANNRGVAENLRRFLRGRQQGEASRVAGKIKETLSPADYLDSADDMMQTMRDNANRLYAKANPVEIKSEKLDKLMARPVIKRAVAKARELAQIEGRELPPPNTTEFIDDVKKGLDRLLEGRDATNQFGRLNKKGYAINNVKKELLNEVDRLNPAYATARKAYSSDAEVVTALTDGVKWRSLSPGQLKRKLQGMTSEAAREAYRIGVANSLRDTVAKVTDDASASRKLIGNSYLREQIRSVMPDRKTANDLLKTLFSEIRFKDTSNFALTGSRTAPMAASDKEFAMRVGGAGAVGGSRVGSMIGAHELVVAGLGRRLAMAKASGLFSKRTAELAKILVETDPQKNAAIIDDIVSRMGKADERARADLSKAIARMAAQQLGLKQ